MIVVYQCLLCANFEESMMHLHHSSHKLRRVYMIGIIIVGMGLIKSGIAEEKRDMPCDQMFYKAATTCDFEGIAEANAMIACLSLKLVGTGCELEIKQLEEVDECGLGCAPVWVVPDEHAKQAEQNDANEIVKEQQLAQE